MKVRCARRNNENQQIKRGEKKCIPNESSSQNHNIAQFCGTLLRQNKSVCRQQLDFQTLAQFAPHRKTNNVPCFSMTMILFAWNATHKPRVRCQRTTNNTKGGKKPPLHRNSAQTTKSTQTHALHVQRRNKKVERNFSFSFNLFVLCEKSLVHQTQTRTGFYSAGSRIIRVTTVKVYAFIQCARPHSLAQTHGRHKHKHTPYRMQAKIPVQIDCCLLLWWLRFCPRCLLIAHVKSMSNEGSQWTLLLFVEAACACNYMYYVSHCFWLAVCRAVGLCGVCVSALAFARILYI